MADSAHQNFTNRLMESPETAARLAEVYSRIVNMGDPATGRPTRWPLLKRLLRSIRSSPVRRLQAGTGLILAGSIMDDEHTAAAFDREFFRAAEKGDDVAVLTFLLAGFDPNRKRPRWGDTALHIAATRDARDVARVLIESGKCDYRIPDRHGNLASTNAYLYGRNPALARLLSIKERKQAEAQGRALK